MFHKTFCQLRLFASLLLKIPLLFRTIITHHPDSISCHILDHNSFNFRPFEDFEADPRFRKYHKTFCQIRLFEICLLKRSSSSHMITTRLPDSISCHILDHNSINSCLISEFRIASRPSKHPFTFWLLRLFDIGSLKIPSSLKQ